MKNKTIPVIIALLTLLFGQGLFLKLYYAPRLSYEVLPVHLMDTNETHSYLIRNSGHTRVNNVLVTLTATGNLNMIRLDGPEITDTSGQTLIQGGALGSPRMQVSFPRILKGELYTLTVQTKPRTDISIAVAADEANGSLATPASAGSPSFVIGMIVSLLTAAVAGLVAYRTRGLVRYGYCRAKRRESGLNVKHTMETVTLSIAALLDTLDEHGVRTDIQKEQYHVRLRAARAALEVIRDFGELAEVDGVCFDTVEGIQNTALPIPPSDSGTSA